MKKQMNEPVAPQFAVHVLQDVQEDTTQLTAVQLLLRDQASDLSTSNNTAIKMSKTLVRIVLGFKEFISADMILPSA